MQPTTQRPSGIVTFAGVLAIMIGGFNAIAGLAGIVDDDELERNATEILFGISTTIWGWVWLAIGVAQIVIGLLIIRREPVGLLLGVGWAVVSATLTAFVIFSYPTMALIVIGVDVLVIWALLSNADEFGTDTP